MKKLLFSLAMVGLAFQSSSAYAIPFSVTETVPGPFPTTGPFPPFVDQIDVTLTGLPVIGAGFELTTDLLLQIDLTAGLNGNDANVDVFVDGAFAGTWLNGDIFDDAFAIPFDDVGIAGLNMGQLTIDSGLGPLFLDDGELLVQFIFSTDVQPIQIPPPFESLTVNASGEFGTSSTTSPVPEPTSIALFGLGAAGIFVLARRRKKEQTEEVSA